MFGQQDDTQQAQNPAWSDQPAQDMGATQPTDNTYLGASAQPQANPVPALLEEQASDGLVTTPSMPTSAPAIGVSGSETPANDLLDIKQNALAQLSPLVGHLEQSPEEKFRTTMMMIQASDDQSLIKTAYEAANQITDEKAKAQALLDIVNEINYFTQH